jgi:hypothetical protein
VYIGKLEEWRPFAREYPANPASASQSEVGAFSANSAIDWPVFPCCLHRQLVCITGTQRFEVFIEGNRVSMNGSGRAIVYYMNAKDEQGRGRKGCPAMGFDEMGKADEGKALESRLTH